VPNKGKEDFQAKVFAADGDLVLSKEIASFKLENTKGGPLNMSEIENVFGDNYLRPLYLRALDCNCTWHSL